MYTLLKLIAGIIGAIILLVIITVICGIVFIHPNNIKNQLSKQVYSSTGRQLTIGDISWTIFPWLGIKVDDISLSNPPGFDNKIFAQAKQAEIAAKFVPLLHGHVELGQLTIDGLNLNLVKNAQGVSNWQGLLKSTNPQSSTSIQSNKKTYPISTKKNLVISLSGITLKDATLNWVDQQQNKSVLINNIQCDVDNLSFNQAFPVSLSFSLNDNHKIRASFQLQTTSSDIRLTQLLANIDDTQITGDINISNFSDPYYQFKLNADNIDLNHLSSSKASSPANNSANNNSAGSSDNSGLLPIALIRKLNANGDFSINTLTIARSSISNFYTHIIAKNGAVQFNPFNGDIYQGQMHNTIAIDVRNTTPQYTISAIFTGIQVESLLTELADITRVRVSGSGDLSANVTASGNSSSDIKQTLSGNTKFSISDGVLYGIDIPYYSNVADLLLKRQMPTTNNTHQTSFGNLTGTATITNGLVSNNDLLVQSPDLTVTGKGTADLVSEQLNYEMIIQRNSNGVPQGPDIPLNIKGTFNHPTIKPNISDILKSQVAKQLEQQVTKKLENVIGNGNVGQQLQKGLKSLFGQ